jgi:hypothetical protein
MAVRTSKYESYGLMELTATSSILTAKPLVVCRKVRDISPYLKEHCYNITGEKIVIPTSSFQYSNRNPIFSGISKNYLPS